MREGCGGGAELLACCDVLQGNVSRARDAHLNDVSHNI